jgi:hypothetical protein
VEYLEMAINESDFELLGIDFDKTYDQLAQKVQRKRVINRRDPIIDRIFDFVSTNVITSFARWSVFSHFFDRVDMIDINCGNGINLFKIYEYAVLMRKNNFYYYGYNENRIQINSPFNGAISRYEKFRADKTYSNFPICTFNIYNIYQILDNVTTKFNHLIGLDAYIFQDSKSKILTISKIIQRLMVSKSFIFLILANESFYIDDKLYNINCNIDTCISIMSKNNIQICEDYSLDEHIRNLDSIKPAIPNMTNRKTAEFLMKTLQSYDKLKNLSLHNLHFFVLYKH